MKTYDLFLLFILTREEGSDKDAHAGPEVSVGPGDVDGKTRHLPGTRVRVDDSQSQEPTHTWNTQTYILLG